MVYFFGLCVTKCGKSVLCRQFLNFRKKAGVGRSRARAFVQAEQLFAFALAFVQEQAELAFAAVEQQLFVALAFAALAFAHVEQPEQPREKTLAAIYYSNPVPVVIPSQFAYTQPD